MQEPQAEQWITVGGTQVRLTCRPEHLTAHMADCSLPWSEVVGEIARILAQQGSREGIVHVTGIIGRTAGVSGCIEVEPGAGAFWAFRRDRAIPSRVIFGDKRLTNELCVWGRWMTEDHFELYTVYPGAAAPREIHDPAISLDEIETSVGFWSRHALVIQDLSEVTTIRTADLPGDGP